MKLTPKQLKRHPKTEASLGLLERSKQTVIKGNIVN